MKGHVGDGARSRELQALCTGNQVDATFLRPTTVVGMIHVLRIHYV